MKLHHKENYKVLRGKEYPDIGDQLDAIWKALEVVDNMPEEAIEMLHSIKQVKQKFHK